MSNHYRLIGMIGSPYSMKMRAILRYRHIPFHWVLKNTKASEEVAHVKPPIIPVLQFPEDKSYHLDSTPLVYELEKRHPDKRSIIPHDPVLAFLSYLIEDMADEWVTKMMYGYRWWFTADQKYCSLWMVHMGGGPAKREDLQKAAQMITDVQTSRLGLVGCTEENKSIIEDSFLHLLDILERNQEDSYFLFGTRPSLADFGLYGQLYQLNHDPTSLAIMREKSPLVCSWIDIIDDASGMEDGEWIDSNAPLPEAVTELLSMAGEVYFPFLLANTKAFEQGDKSFSLTLLNRPYEQETFKYQAKCHQWLREKYAELSVDTKDRVDSVLKDTGCLEGLV
ncbi:MAG: glutathione S-transferase [Deltaproteobacteria bacterium]|nr:glutathione S-transferase [Deltaproteobacteria bacterium]